MSDLISREALCEYALNQKDKSITPNDIMRFPSAQPKKRTEERTETHACDCISRQAAIDALDSINCFGWVEDSWAKVSGIIEHVPSAQQDIAEKLYLYKCYITDQEGLQHEVIHTGDIRRVTGWEI